MSDIPDTARAVIIGGGVVGCSIAYHLAVLGWDEIVLIERGELTSGSTFHSAGLIGQLRSTINLTRMVRYSIDLYRSLKNETGQDTGWKEVGSVRLATNQPRMEEQRRMISLSRSFGIPLEWIGQADIRKLYPMANLDDVIGGLYSPHDGFIDPSGLTMALAAGAKHRGVQVVSNTRVEDIVANEGQVERVITDRGEVRTRIVIVAAGMWAGEIGALVGLKLPVIPMSHQYLITRPMDGVHPKLPLLRDPDYSTYFREEVGGLIVGGYESDPKPLFLSGIPADFNHQLLPSDWPRFEALMESAIHRLPDLETAEISMLLNGPEGFTPDGEPLLGPGAVKGVWIAAAFSAHGLAMAGAVGKSMAEWIVHGYPEWDLWQLDLRRFNSNYTSTNYTLSRVRETYSKYYSVRYPHEERQSVRRLRLSPIYNRLVELGAEFGEKSGWERANWFRSNEVVASHGHSPHGWPGYYWSPAIGVEHIATRTNASLFDLSSFGKIEVVGKGALSYLQGLCSNDIDRPCGSITYTSMLNPRGGIECDFTITRFDINHFLIITGTSLVTHNLSYIRENMPEDGSIMVQDISSAYACLGLWGPKSREILQKVTEQDISNAQFPYLTCKMITVGNVPVTALRVTYVGELGWELYCPAEYGLMLWDTIWKAGAGSGITAAGYRAIDSLRLEKGYRLWGADITPDYTPLEAGLRFAVKLDKGQFRGREYLVEQARDGIQKKLCCLSLKDRNAVAIGGEPILLRDGGEVIGWVTSGGYGYVVGKSIAYGYLPIEHSRVGNLLQVEIMDERIDAVIEKEPLWDPQQTRVRS